MNVVIARENRTVVQLKFSALVFQPSPIVLKNACVRNETRLQQRPI
jgi:hypothetical protein